MSAEASLSWHMLRVQVNLPYHIRVLVPCYRENLQIVTDTLQVCAAVAQQGPLIC